MLPCIGHNALCLGVSHNLVSQSCLHLLDQPYVQLLVYIGALLMYVLNNAALLHLRGRPVGLAPLELGGMWLPWSTLSGDLLCTPWLYVNYGCLERGRGILPWEYNHMRSQQHAEANTSTIHAVHDGHAEHAAGDAVEESHFALARHVVEIDAATEAETLQPLQDKLVLLLDNLVHVAFAEGMPKQKQGYDKFWQECVVLDTAAYTAIYDLDGNESGKPMADLGLSHRPARLSRGRLHQHYHA